jgi:hypothetical protein
MVQWLDQDDIAGLEEIAARVMPQVRASRESRVESRENDECRVLSAEC